MSDLQQAIAWFEGRAQNTPMPGARKMFQIALEALLEKAERGWISVRDKDRKPETGTRYLVVRYDYVTKTSFKDILWYDKGTWWNRQHGGDFAVTHWMPLPELPKGDKKE